MSVALSEAKNEVPLVQQRFLGSLYRSRRQCGETGSSWGLYKAFYVPNPGEFGRTPGALGLDTKDGCKGASYGEAG